MRILIKIHAAQHFSTDFFFFFFSERGCNEDRVLPAIVVVLHCDVPPLEECVRGVYGDGEQLLADVSSWAVQNGYLKRPYRYGNEQVFKIPLPTGS